MTASRLIQVIGFLVVIAFVVGGLGLRPRQTSESAPESAINVMSTSQAIDYFAERVATSPTDAVSATVLGELHNRRARETGDINEFALAVRSLEHATDRLPEYAPARLALATAHFGLHQFDAARAEAARSLSLDPRNGAEVVLADVAVATGDYEAAAEIYEKLRVAFDSPTLEARIAHLSEISGDYPSAIERMIAARVEARQQRYEGEQLAWFDLRLGDLSFAVGDYQAAESSYRDSLAVFERYPAAVAGLARSLAAQHRVDEAAIAYERAIEMQPLPQTLLDAARFYESIGEIEMAQSHRTTIDVIGELSDGVFDRALIANLIDTGRSSEALTKAVALAVGRSDTYTLDTLAWAQFNAGNVKDAARTIDLALAHGSLDPVVLFHAGAIKAASDPEAAVALVRRALEISPSFDPVGAPTAAALLASLQP